jgi:tRNA A-37 threonylcarbamoyl transferase component Bud32
MAASHNHGPRVFISHSSKDNYFGLRLVADLRSSLGDESAVWYDSADGLIGGDSWWSKIVQELTARDIFIIILSADAMGSQWVMREFDMAMLENKRIVPLLYRKCNVRTDLKLIQSISFLDSEHYDAAFRKLLQALGLPQLGEKPNRAPKAPETVFLQNMTPQIAEAFKSQDWSDVIRKADYVIKQAPGALTSEIYHKQGMAFFKERKMQEAGVALNAALALISDREQRLAIMQDYAAVLNAQERWTELLSIAEAALQLKPANSAWWRTVQKKAQDALDKGPKQQFGSYGLIRLLGERTLGEVVLSRMYLGQHISYKNSVMVKVLNISLQGKDRAQFLSEISIIASLVHPNILQIIDFGIEKNTPFLVTGSIPKGSLRQRHALGIKLPLHGIKTYVKQVAAGLQYAHDQNVVHGNLMPENMLLGPNQEILLSDFHIAIIAQRMKRRSNSIYLAPEQLAGQQDPATDQYALAVVVYEWLTGNQPSLGDLTFMDKSMQELSIFVPPIRNNLSNISPAIESALMKALNKDPRQRFRSIKDFADALEKSFS